MPFHRAGQLARETPVARAGDPLGLVAENLRESHYGAIPVIDGDLDKEGRPSANSRVLGLIFDHDLARAVLPVLERQEIARMAGGQAASWAGEMPAPIPHPGSLNGHANGHGSGRGIAAPNPPTIDEAASEIATIRGIETLTARDVMQEHVAVVPTLFSLHNALLTLERYNAPALPVVDENGAYRGMIGRADVVAALGRYVRPPVVGGMATPLGVWLTTGYLSAGAPPVGLFLSGALMGALFLLSHYIMFFGLLALNHSWGEMFLNGRLGAASDATNAFNISVTVAEYGLFLLLLRLVPLAGTHAAEHQTVWAIERGVPLEPEYVKKMPRAHPRCGTNLVALGGLIEIVIGHLPEVNPGTVLGSLLLVYFTWRRFGTAIQQNFTTRPATPRQLQSGIEAGKALLEKYQEQPHLLTSFGSRVFNSGLLLSASGLILVQTLFWWFDGWAARAFLGG